MRLEFNSVSELAEFFDFMQGSRHQIASLAMTAGAMFAEGAQDGETVELTPAPEQATDIVAEGTVESPEPKVKRTRRTKAEMEAARAAVTEALERGEVVENPFAQQAEAQAPANPQFQEEVAKIAQTDPHDVAGDAAGFIKARVAERPELTQIEHLNVARAFIGKYGMDKYNQSFALAGVTNNVMAYQPSDCALHAAALDFLSLE